MPRMLYSFNCVWFTLNDKHDFEGDHIMCYPIIRLKIIFELKALKKKRDTRRAF